MDRKSLTMQRIITFQSEGTNTVTVASLEQVVESDPMAFIHAITPTPLLMIIATADTTVPPELQRAAFAQAGEPKRLFTYQGDHYDIYDLPETTLLAASEARAWFTTYLKQ